MSKIIWTKTQIASANAFQKSGLMHPFTCGNDKCRSDLIATEKGWICPNCDYTQDWAHSFMLDWSWRRVFGYIPRTNPHILDSTKTQDWD